MQMKQAVIFFRCALLCFTTIGVPSYAQTAGHVDWHGWSLVYAVTDLSEGLALLDVSYQGALIISKASFPIMRVFYENDACGPYADRLESPFTPVSWANDAIVVEREFTQNGQTWLELGIQDIIGNYVIYQVWYLSADGVIDAHIFSKGLQCNYFHTHLPYWRLDFDLGDIANDQIRMWADTDWSVLSTGFNAAATDAPSHRWQVHDPNQGLSVDILFDDNSWNVDGDVIPESQYETNMVFGRAYQESEDTGWRWSVRSELPGRDREDIEGQDVVLWYKGYMPHTPEEGPDLWHSTGIRLVIRNAQSGHGDSSDTILSTTDRRLYPPGEAP